ncbi:MAG: hypothetical protein IKX57_03045 [Oscillospiraceae bacterium]|nr:hypothetical protein [Oscillospiraceae bacterium]
MKILNLHGFLGAADNRNYRALCEFFPAEQIISPALDYEHTAPDDLIAELLKTASEPDVILVGQSLGGFYADHLSRRLQRFCLLTNPCMYPHTLPLITESGIPQEYVRQYEARAAYSVNRLSRIICGDADTLLTDNIAVCKTLSKDVRVIPGGHSSLEALSVHLESALRDVLPKQEHP